MHYGLPVTGVGFTVGGITLSLYQLTWIGIAMVVIGATILTVGKLFPRIAIEPVPRGGRWRFALTVNGRPVWQ